MCLVLKGWGWDTHVQGPHIRTWDTNARIKESHPTSVCERVPRLPVPSASRRSVASHSLSGCLRRPTNIEYRKNVTCLYCKPPSKHHSCSSGCEVFSMSYCFEMLIITLLYSWRARRGIFSLFEIILWNCKLISFWHVCNLNQNCRIRAKISEIANNFASFGVFIRETKSATGRQLAQI